MIELIPGTREREPEFWKLWEGPWGFYPISSTPPSFPSSGSRMGPKTLHF